MTLGVNTNVGVLSALQGINRTNAALQQVQNRINTGQIVSGAKDDGGVYAIAQFQRSDVRALAAIGSTLRRAKSVVDVGLAAGESISDLLIQMKEKVVAACDNSLDTNGRAAINEDFVALRKQIVSIIANAKFGGSNLIGSSAGFQVLANADGSSTISVNAQNLSLGNSLIAVAATDTIIVQPITYTSASPDSASGLSVTARYFSFGGSIITIPPFATIDTQASASGLLATIDKSLSNTGLALARLGSTSSRLDAQIGFNAKVSDLLTAGIGNLVDADLSVESARLQSLQVKQQLGLQALSIANGAPQALLRLFKQADAPSAAVHRA